jgi:ankyrin repeat protein
VNGIRGSTPLHAAAINGLTDIFMLLLDAGADPNVRNEVSFVFYRCTIFLSHCGWLFIHVDITLNN